MMRSKIPVFKLRASKASLFLVDPKSKSEKLSAGAKTYLEDWLKEQIYGVRKEFYSTVTEKGNVVESESIYYAIDWLDLPFFVKNEVHYENEYFTGTPDGLPEELVVDQKNSWDCFTFPLFEREIPTKAYDTQLQVYMNLTGRKKGLLVYTLLNTPAHLEKGDVRDYSELPVALRNRVFEVAYDKDVIKKLEQRVLDAREYIESLLKFIENGFTE